MIVELFGDSEAEALADLVFAVFKECQMHGVLDVKAKTYPNVDATGALSQLREIGAGTTFPVDVMIDEPGMSISGVLHRSGPDGDAVTGFAELERIPDDVRSFGTASRINGGPSNLRLIRIGGPRRSPTELGKYLLEKMADAAENQLSGNVGGVLVLEFARVEDPTVFRDNLGVRHMLNELFGRYRHLAAIVLRAAQVSRVHEDHSEMNQFAYVEKSAVTSFPESG